MKKEIVLFICLFGLAGCNTPQPNNVSNICKIFKQYPKWYWAAQDSQEKWGVPMSVQMAVMHQESRFASRAKPPRTKLLWVIPWRRPSTAYGYSQALNQTWDTYIKSSGNHGADRDVFADAVDFVGWYGYTANRKIGIDKRNAYELYLSYHEGYGGYKRKTYLKKPWLVKVARKVESRAHLFHDQLVTCQNKLPRKPWYYFW